MTSLSGTGRIRLRRFAATLAIASALFASSAQAEPAKASDAFVDSIGVNVHFLYSNYIDLFDSVVVPRMKEIGLRHYRDGILLNDPPFVQRLAAVHTACGAKGTFITRPTQFPAVIEWAKGAAQYVDTLEGPNEPHNEEESSVYKGLEQPASLKPYQQDLYAAVRAEPTLSHVLVATPGIDWFGGYLSVGDLDQWADVGNFHHWPPSTGLQQNGMNKGNAPTDGLYKDRSGGPGLLEGARAIASTKPLIATETGFSTTQVPATQDNGWDPGVSDAAAARYATRVFLELFNNGVKRTFLYELVDEWDTPQPVKKHQGMIRQDGTLKPHGVAIKNMITLLTDPGADFQLGSLDFQLTSTASLIDDKNHLTADIHHVLLQKRSGAFYLVLWNEALSYDNLTEQDIAVADQAVTLTLTTPIERVRTYRPLDGVNPLETLANPATVTLMVPDHPLIVEINPPGTTTPDPVGVGGAGGAGGAAGAGGAPSMGGTPGVGTPVAGSTTMTPAQAGSSGIVNAGASSGGADNGLMGPGSGTEPGGCACTIPASTRSREGLWALSLLALYWLRRRRPGD
jgi:MYXO-CTERM domain-containing protein